MSKYPVFARVTQRSHLKHNGKETTNKCAIILKIYNKLQLPKTIYRKTIVPLNLQRINQTESYITILIVPWYQCTSQI